MFVLSAKFEMFLPLNPQEKGSGISLSLSKSLTEKEIKGRLGEGGAASTRDAFPHAPTARSQVGAAGRTDRKKCLRSGRHSFISLPVIST
jgi:hypothetical protein